MTTVEKIKILLDRPSEEDVETIYALKEIVEDEIKAYTFREEVPKALEKLVIDLVVKRYNKRGTEGEKSRSEGSVSISYEDDLTESQRRLLNQYRKVGVIRAPKKEKRETDTVLQDDSEDK